MSRLLSGEPVVRLHQVDYKGKRFSVLCFEESEQFTGGNKWYKLRENIRLFREGGYSGIVSVGGDHSNHIAALAAAGAMEQIPVTGIIRGERAQADTVTLRRAEQMGMELVYVSRSVYRELRNPDFARHWLADRGSVYVIPEGGSNAAGRDGCRRMAMHVPESATDVWLAVGTGATLAGVRQGLRDSCFVHGVKVVEAKQEDALRTLIADASCWRMYDAYTFGGYAQHSDQLAAFVEEWNRETGLRIEPVYTGRAFFAAVDQFTAGTTREPPVLMHTGGLQYCTD